LPNKNGGKNSTIIQKNYGFSRWKKKLGEKIKIDNASKRYAQQSKWLNHFPPKVSGLTRLQKIVENHAGTLKQSIAWEPTTFIFSGYNPYFK